MDIKSYDIVDIVMIEVRYNDHSREYTKIRLSQPMRRGDASAIGHEILKNNDVMRIAFWTKRGTML